MKSRLIQRARSSPSLLVLVANILVVHLIVGDLIFRQTITEISPISKLTFPYLGVSLLFLLWILVLFRYSKKTRYTTILVSLGVLLCVFLVLRANAFVTFLNVVSLMYICSYLILKSKLFSEPTLFLAPLAAALEALKVRSKAFNVVIPKNHDSKISLTILPKVLTTTVFTVLFLLGILPLLTEANRGYMLFIGDLLNFLSLEKLEATISFFLGLLLPHIFITPVFFSFFSFCVGYVAQNGQKTNESKTDKYNIVYNKQENQHAHLFKQDQNSNNLNFSDLLHLPSVKLVISVFIIIFIAFQTDLYLGGLDLSHSQRTREVFFNLSIVSLLTFGLIYFDNNKGKLSLLSSKLLLVLNFILLVFALISDIEYIHQWGLTYARINGLFFVMWVFLITISFSQILLENRSKEYFLKTIFLGGLSLVLLYNIVNPDALIYNYIPNTHEGRDYNYLSNLSTDSGHYEEITKYLEDSITPLSGLSEQEKVQLMKTDFKKYKTLSDNRRFYNQRISNHDVRVVETYNKKIIGSFNLSEYRHYLQISD